MIANIKMYQRKLMLKNRVKELQGALEKAEEKQRTLEEMAYQKDKSPYIEKIAREELDLQLPGEKVFSFIDTATTRDSNVKSENIFQIWWQGILDFFE